LACDAKGRTGIEDIRQKAAEGNAWVGRFEVREAGEIFTMRTVMVCTPCLPVHAAQEAMRAPRARLDVLVERKNLSPREEIYRFLVNK